METERTLYKMYNYCRGNPIGPIKNNKYVPIRIRYYVILNTRACVHMNYNNKRIIKGFSLWLSYDNDGGDAIAKKFCIIIIIILLRERSWCVCV